MGDNLSPRSVQRNAAHPGRARLPFAARRGEWCSQRSPASLAYARFQSHFRFNP